MVSIGYKTEYRRNPSSLVDSLNDWQTINANDVVAESMANIDAEYEALCAEFSMASVWAVLTKSDKPVVRVKAPGPQGR